MSTRWWVLHVDLDQFLAAVEILRHPELRGKPVVVGGEGDPTQPRAVVATASYEAREYGVHSGMPMRLAGRKCPDAVFLPSDAEAYEEMSERVMAALWEEVTLHGGPGGAVEVIGWDEAFAGVESDDPEPVAAGIQDAIRRRTALSCAVGIGDNKLRAKIATGFGKPGGRFRLTKENWFEVMGDRPTEALWGVGRKTAAKLAEMGLHTVSELAASDRNALAARLGPKLGPWYWLLGQGFADSEVTATPWLARSRSRETTYPQNIEDWGRVGQEVTALARRVVADVADEGRPVARVGVKVRFAPFVTASRSVGLPEPSMSGDEIEKAALTALAKFEPPHRPVRLLGVRAEFTTPPP